MIFKYIHDGKSHSNTGREYMISLGMDVDTIESVLRQKNFEAAQDFAQRESIYRKESDPLYMEAQFDGTPESLQIWRDKVTEIKARYPAPPA